MRPAVSSKKKAIILGALVGVFALWWYSHPFPWLGVVIGLISGFFTFFILNTRKMERLRLIFFMGISLFVIVTLAANIFKLGVQSFLWWANTQFEPGYWIAGEGTGATPFPLPIYIPTILLGKASFLVNDALWKSVQATSLDVFLVFMIPYIITFLIFERSFCGWFCPLGGLPEAMSSLPKKRRWFLKFLEKKPSQAAGFSFTGLSGLKGWVEWTGMGFW